MSWENPRAWETAGEPRIYLHGWLQRSKHARGPGAGQVAPASGPLALNYCDDSPHHWEPVEIISSGPERAEGCLAHCLPRIALALTRQFGGQVNFLEHLAVTTEGCSGVTLMQYGRNQINEVLGGLVFSVDTLQINLTFRLLLKTSICFTLSINTYLYSCLKEQRKGKKKSLFSLDEESGFKWSIVCVWDSRDSRQARLSLETLVSLWGHGS